MRTVAAGLAPGSAIGFDYPARRILERRAGLAYRMTRWLARRIGEPWTFGIPDGGLAVATNRRGAGSR